MHGYLRQATVLLPTSLPYGAAESRAERPAVVFLAGPVLARQPEGTRKNGTGGLLPPLFLPLSAELLAEIMVSRDISNASAE
jgi:hypothetical protein